MSDKFKTPGVYVREVSARTPSIAGVATSLTAFVGRADRGPVDDPVPITSFDAFEEIFGGLSVNSEMSYAVADYFRNGGRDAIVVRLFNSSAAGVSRARIDMDGTELEANDPGAWGNALFVEVSDVIDPPANPQAESFNLAVYEREDGIADEDLAPRELYRNVTLAPGPNQLDTVLAERSSLIHAVADGPSRPLAGRYSVAAAGVADDGAGLVETDYIGNAQTGLYALDKTDLFNLLCIPPDFAPAQTYPGRLAAEAAAYCRRRRAIFLYDPPADWQDAASALAGLASTVHTGNTALYFPRIVQPDPLNDNQPRTAVPCGAVAGVIARTDSTRGVWKAPAGTQATLDGVSGLAINLSPADNRELNRSGINCLLSRPRLGTVVWGARTLTGSNAGDGGWQYLPVVRTTLFIEESLIRGLHWVVFEPNDERLWARIRQAVEAFMASLFRAGALTGRSPDEAYFVRCDRSTMSATDVSEGRVIVEVGYALLRRAEFRMLVLPFHLDG